MRVRFSICRRSRGNKAETETQLQTFRFSLDIGTMRHTPQTLHKGQAFYLFSCLVSGDGAEAATTRASRRSKRVTRGQPATPWKIESDTSHKIWRHPDRYFPYSLV